MRGLWPLAVVALACSAPPTRSSGTAMIPTAASSPIASSLDARTPGPVAALAEPTPAASASVAPPAFMPARYLRSLEHDPQGYGALSRASSTAVKNNDLLLGDLLFHSPAIMGARARAMEISCQTCHPNGATHTTIHIENLSDRAGNLDLSTHYFRRASDDGIFNPVNVPSLRGLRFTGPYGHDGRIASLSEFIAGVVTIELGGESLSSAHLSALTRYVMDLDLLPNKNLDRRGMLTAHVTVAARRGEVVFRGPRAAFGGMSCASCHIPSAYFRDGRVHRIGSGKLPSPHALEGGEETPTLLGLAETAPFFHDGSLASIPDVVAWFDREFALGLSPRQRADLSAYVEAVAAVDRPRDDRALARRLDETFAYLSLLDESQPDRRIWVIAVAAVSEPLRRAPAAVGPRADALLRRLDSLRARVAAGAGLLELAGQARSLRVALSRLAADWAGSLSAAAG